MIKIIYTKEILEDIIPKYQAGEIDIILKKYPNLSKNALYQKMSKLKIKMLYKEWSKEELGILNEYSCAAEPPVQCNVSHLSRRSEPQ